MENHLPSPGPWHAAPGHLANGSAGLITSREGDLVADVAHAGDVSLIAAAPDLLAVLEQVLADEQSLLSETTRRLALIAVMKARLRDM